MMTITQWEHQLGLSVGCFFFLVTFSTLEPVANERCSVKKNAVKNEVRLHDVEDFT